eukprot:Pgem_evm1s11778
MQSISYINSFPAKIFEIKHPSRNRRDTGASLTIQRGSPTTIAYDGVSDQAIKDVDMTFAFCGLVSKSLCVQYENWGIEDTEQQRAWKQCSYREQTECLRNVGWTVGGEQWQHHASAGGDLTVNSAINHALSSVLMNDEMEIINR